MKIYSISEVSKMFGVSCESLRNYERRGLITPTRTKTGYRAYTFTDVYIISKICVLRSAGYSFREIERFKTAEYEQALSLRESRLLQMEADVDYQKLKLQAVRQEYQELLSLQRGSAPIEWVMCPRMLRINNQVNDSFLINDHIVTWANHLPIVRISPAFSVEAIESGEAEIRFGYAVSLEIGERLGLSDMPGVQRKESVRCLTTTVNSKGPNMLTSHSLAGVQDYCLQNGYRISDEVWGVTICSFIEQGETTRYHRLYIPVRPA